MKKENKNIETKAIIYCRVSSQKQVNEGHGLDTQERNSKAYAESKNYIIEKVFRDEAISGRLLDRPAMRELLSYIDKHPYTNYVVIIDDLSRLSRDIEVHITLRKEFAERGVGLESPNFSFENSPEGDLIEKVSVVVNEYNRKSNARQVSQKMRSRMAMGYWCLCPPDVYKFIKDPLHGKIIVPKEPFASIWKEAIELYANDEVYVIQELRRHIIELYDRHGINKSPSTRTVERYLTNPLLAGYIEYPEWDIALRKGHHKGIISLETHRKAKYKLKRSKTRNYNRVDYSDDFPLRGFVACNGCGQPFTASWSTGRSERYPYYSCKNPECCMRYKGIRQDDLHNDFRVLLEKAKIKNNVSQLVKEIYIDVWEHNTKDLKAQKIQKQKEIEKIDKTIETFLNRIEKTNNEQLISMYENTIAKAIDKKNEINDTTQVQIYDETFRNTFEEVLECLANPSQTWELSYTKAKTEFLYLYFVDRPTYDRNDGFGTVTFHPCINLLGASYSPKSSMVEMAGVEPTS